MKDANFQSLCGCCVLDDDFNLTCTDTTNVRSLPKLAVPAFRARGFLRLDGFIPPAALSHLKAIMRSPVAKAYELKGLAVNQRVSNQERHDSRVPKGRHKIYAPMTEEIEKALTEALHVSMGGGSFARRKLGRLRQDQELLLYKKLRNSRPPVLEGVSPLGNSPCPARVRRASSSLGLLG